MMTPKEAIERLKAQMIVEQNRKPINDGGKIDRRENVKSLNMAISALQKQIPKFDDKKLTNFEKIKAMSIDEMAKIIECPRSEVECKGDISCTACCKQWLESEAEE